MNRCRHFNHVAALRGDADACKIGHPIAKIVKARHPDTRGINLFPCFGRKTAVECPSFDPKTDAEIAADRQRMSEHMTEVVKGLAGLGEIRRRMNTDGQRASEETCVWCGAEGALHVTISGYNGHMWALCRECKKGVIE